MLEPGAKQQRLIIPYFEGVNSLVSFNMAKKTEFVHVENARSLIIGTIEKRGGQTVLGTNSVGKPFVTTNNYGLFSFQNAANQGLYRISVAENSTLSINISETILMAETYIPTLVDPGGARRAFDPNKHYLLPFPQSEIDINELLEQNHGY